MLLFLLACGTTSRPTCITVSTTEIADDEVTDLGFSPAELIAQVEGVHPVSATLADDSPIDAEVTVGRGVGSATVVLTEESSITTKNGQLWGTSVLTIAVTCLDTVQVPMDLSVETSDSSIAVSESATAMAQDLSGVELNWDGPIAEFEGVPAVDDAEYGYLEARFEPDLPSPSGFVAVGGDTESSSWAEYLLSW